MFSKVVQIISKAVFTLIDRFKNSPKVNNLFGLLLRAKFLPRTFKNCPIWSHCSVKRQKGLTEADRLSLAVALVVVVVVFHLLDHFCPHKRSAISVSLFRAGRTVADGAKDLNIILALFLIIDFWRFTSKVLMTKGCVSKTTENKRLEIDSK